MSSVGALFDTALRPRLEMVCASSPDNAEPYSGPYGFHRATDNRRTLVGTPEVEAIIIATPQAWSIWWALTISAPPQASSRASSSPTAKSVTSHGFAVNDFLADPDAPASWRTSGMANGTMGDLAPHMINGTLALIGPIARTMGLYETVHEIMGTKGAIRFGQEDQNALWLYRMNGPEATRGFTRILTGPAHPDDEPFCQGPGHRTGYQDQIIIEAKDFLTAIATGKVQWPTFHDGHDVNPGDCRHAGLGRCRSLE